MRSDVQSRDASGAHAVSDRGTDFRLLFESAPVLLLVLDPGLHVVAVTDGYLRATQTERAAIMGRHLFAIFPDNPDEEGATGVSNLRRSLQHVLADKRPDTMALQKYDIQVQTPERVKFEVKYWSPVNTPVLAPDGSVQLIIHRVEDVTEFVRLREQQNETGSAVEQLKTRAGLMEAELIQRATEIQTSNARLRSLQSELERRVEQRTAELVLRNDELRREVDERVRAEAALHTSQEHLRAVELRATQDALERAHNVFNRFFELSLDLMCICGTDGFFRRVNPAFLKLGYSEEELLSVPMVEFMHPDDRARTQSNLRKLDRGEATTGSENRYRCKDGSYRWISWSSTPEGDGTIYAMGRDITEERKASDELRRAQLAAESANRELESFSYTVAHDLRAPLRSIDGFSQALLEDYADKIDGEGKNYLARLRAGAQRMAHLIDDLLALSKLSRGALNSEPIDLGQLARTVVEQLRDTYPERKVEVTIHDGLTAHGDARLLSNVLENLIGNAWKFTSRCEQARIEIGVTNHEDQQAFFVRDNGAGFDMAYQHKLFGAFQRLHAVQEFEGTGIGLASVQRVINRHGGRIWPEAAVGQGATFYFTLPGEERS